jgi:hypothetical protein|tara:strand:- start:9113 stop:12862 length:3750 start_codon:yes stop_codon:yes gene_type:complete
VAELGKERREAAEQFRFAHAIENQLTAQQARLFVRSIQNSWGVVPLDWTARQSVELFADARRLIHAASIFEETDGENSKAATDCYRRAGEILEWLARSRDRVTRDVPVEVLAAGAYQLAGLPAMATGLLKRTELQGAGEIFGAFLACDLDRVLGRGAEFWRLHDALTGSEGSAVLLEGPDAKSLPASEQAASPLGDEAEGDEAEGDEAEGDEEPDSDEGALASGERSGSAGRIAWYVVVETVRALGLLADGLRRGEEARSALAMEKLDALADLATRWAGDEAWLVLRLTRATATRFLRNSIHRRGAPLAGGLESASAKLGRFAREQFARGRGVLWPSQVKGLERLVEGRSFALCTPTGSGKTLVANLALVKELLLTPTSLGNPSRLALYLVPSRALAGEVEAKLAAEFRSEQVTVTGLYGGTDWGITDYWLAAETPTVLIATVEKAEALMRYVGHLLMHRLELLIIDEAHQVVVPGDERTMRDLAAHEERAMRLESLVSRLLALKPNISRIALTAVAGGAAPPVARWIEGKQDAVPVGLGYRSSRQLVGVLECRPLQSPRITLELNNGQPLYIRGREDPVFLRLSVPAMPNPPAKVRDSLPHYVQIHALWTALNLVGSGRNILISITQAPDRAMKRCADAFALPGWEAVRKFVPTGDDERQLFNKAREACVDYCGATSYEVRLLDRGIATSHGQMPQRLRRLMVELIERRVCPITIATATLTEGVNLPFDLIILPSIERTTEWLPNGVPVSNIIPTAEFRNLAGRAGRPGAAEAIEGMTLVCLPLANSSRAATKQTTQRNQRNNYMVNLTRMLDALAAEEQMASVVSAPIQTLLASIWSKLRDHLGMTTEAQLHEFLEVTMPEAVSDDIATASHLPLAMLGDSLDELDGFLLSAIDEVERLDAVVAADVEEALKRVWARTFTRYAGAVEEWMERAFVKRGQAVVEHLYPDPAVRRALYQIGFTPYVGRQFQQVSPAIIAALRDAADYGRRNSEDRFQLFWRIGELIRAGRGFGYVGRNATETALVARWHEVAGWWLQRDGAPPPPVTELRRWQNFVANNLEFRLGVTVGAAVAEAWNANAAPLEVPSLEMWKATTGLPWVGFWFRELIRWGTMDPFVAFALAQGLAGTREQAAALRGEFEPWLLERLASPTDEDLIDPQLFIEWSHTRPSAQHSVPAAPVVQATFTEVTGSLARYSVRPILTEDGVLWIDPAGYRVARSGALPPGSERTERHDFEIVNDQFGVRAIKTF